MVSFGWCRGIEDAARLQAAGYDYIECTVTGLQLENQQEHAKLLAQYADSPLPVQAVNIFFPGDLLIVGPTIDENRLSRYVAKTAEALHKIGTKIAVLGSGRSRQIPEGWSAARAEEQFVKLLERVADEFTGTGVVLAIEPLNRQECNFINSVAEASRFAKWLNRDTIRILADFYHMEMDQEPLETMLEHKDWLAHIHVADTGRLSPGTGTYPYDEFAKYLTQAGYNGRISAECTVKENSEFDGSLAFLKKKFN
ncbi:sugar phosphate isomerase/epimerase family protein [Paenibacillus solisilvae]|uniref:Sugar phosphate isomerase/epimerase family protein n=1 Tax=Paenibacillus solisilvae TaxID=2486751 RepID=A0ABW0W442_9BACL